MATGLNFHGFFIVLCAYLSFALQTGAKRSLASRLSGYVPKRKKKIVEASTAGSVGEGGACLLEAAPSNNRETPQMGLWGGGGNTDGISWPTFPGDRSLLAETVPVS